MGGARCAVSESAAVLIGKTCELERFAIEAMGTESELKWLFEGFMVKRMELLLKDIKTKKKKSAAARFKPAQPQVRARFSYK